MVLDAMGGVVGAYQSAGRDNFSGLPGKTDVTLRMPVAVPTGSTASLLCLYDLEGDQLYTVKWYKGRQEFFRYVLKELPHTRVFALPGINVDVVASGAEMVVLRDVQKFLSGKYRCEVSSDAPHFHTEVVSGYMHVVSLPNYEAFFYKHWILNDPIGNNRLVTNPEILEAIRFLLFGQSIYEETLNPNTLLPVSHNGVEHHPAETIHYQSILLMQFE
ncbi:hypothetical protein J6590_082506 [Homalodisca vitripennis]|nr:hypothetical protein J6590_082506 [Homalodisca vitripennis]